ncbi:helix-turn-helix domain-containing protein [Atopobiaceae bacterium 24-176]
MLGETLRSLRKSKGLTQEELAIRLNVVRQTVSKWEQGLSVPDASMLVRLSEELDTPVSTLLGESLPEAEPDGLAVIAGKLEVVNLQLVRRQRMGRAVLFWVLVAVCVAVMATFALLVAMGSPYLEWDLSDSETAVAGTVLHGFEWLFVRVAPLVLLATGAGATAVWRRRS